MAVAATAGALGWGAATLQKDDQGSKWSLFGTGPVRQYASIKELEKVSCFPIDQDEWGLSFISRQSKKSLQSLETRI